MLLEIHKYTYSDIILIFGNTGQDISILSVQKENGHFFKIYPVV